LAGILLLALMVLTGCGWQGTGVVVEKTYSPGYDYVMFMCSAYNAQGICTVQMPLIQHQPDSYGYVVRDSEGKTHDMTTSKQEWDAHSVGDLFDNREKK